MQSSGDARIHDTIKLRQVRPFVVKNQDYVTATKSVFNRIIGDGGFELEFAGFLDKCADVKSFAKNDLAVNFRLDYVKADGDISNYYPDFIVKLTDGQVVIVETKGQKEEDLKQKMIRLRQWCQDVSGQSGGAQYDFAYVDQASFERHRPKSFADLLSGFREYK